MRDDALVPTQMRFAFTVFFACMSVIFATGLASFGMVLEGLWRKAGRGLYANLYRSGRSMSAIAA